MVRSYGRARAVLSQLERLVELAEAIRRDGPLSVARFMSLALHHPTLATTAGATRSGLQGDFVTAPELSQAFGE